MSGICGWLSKDEISEQDDQQLKEMLFTIKHRGLDNAGTYHDAHLFLGQNSMMVDNVVAEKLPTASDDGRFIVAFDGCIANRKELVEKLRKIGSEIQSENDSKITIELYRYFGPQGFSKIIGSFALVLWDAFEQVALLARDEYGFKPLFYKMEGNLFLFGSEIKAILERSSRKPELDLKIMHNFLNFQFIPGPDSLFKDVLQVKPGTVLIWSKEEIKKENLKVVHKPDSIDLDEIIVKSFVEKYDYPSETVHVFESTPQSLVLASIFSKETTAATYFYQLSDDLATDNGDLFNDIRQASGFNVRSEPLPAFTVDFFNKFIWHLELPMPSAVLSFARHKSIKRKFKVGISVDGFSELFLTNSGFSTIDRLEKFNRVPLEKIMDWVASLYEWKIKKDRPDPWVGSNARRKLEQLTNFVDPHLYYAISSGLWDDMEARREIYGEAMLSRGSSIADSFDLFDQLWTKRRTTLDQYRDFERNVRLKYMKSWSADRCVSSVGVEARYPFVDRRIVKLLHRLKTKEINTGKPGDEFIQETFGNYLDANVWGKFEPQDLDYGLNRESIAEGLQSIYDEYLRDSMVDKYKYFNPNFIKALSSIPHDARNQWQHQMLFMMAGIHALCETMIK